MRRGVGAAMIVLLLATACGDDDGGGGDTAGGPSTTRATSTSTSTSAQLSTTAPVATTADDPVVRPMVLQENGLGYQESGEGTLRTLAFDTPVEDASQVLTAQLGKEPVEKDLPECDAGPLVALDYEGIIITYFSGGEFAGWYVDPEAPGPLSTANGIGPGASRAQLDDAFPGLTVQETTLGIEWLAGELFGFLTTDGPDGEVGGMWAGVNCFAR